MSNAQPTPGPWTLIKESPPRIIKPGQHDICEMSGAASHDGVMADARLIAAAPELLEVLQDLLDGMEASGGWQGDEELFNAGMAAVAKATGERA